MKIDYSTEILEFMLENGISYEDACIFFDLSNKELDILLTQEVDENEKNLIKVKNIMNKENKQNNAIIIKLLKCYFKDKIKNADI